MNIKLNGYKRGKFSWDDTEGDIYIMEDGTRVMSTNIDTSNVCFSYYSALLNLETFKVSSCRYELDHRVELSEYGKVEKVISGKDIVFVKKNNRSDKCSKFESIGASEINVSDIKLGDIVVLSDGTKIMIVKTDGVWYSALRLDTYIVSRGYRTLKNLLDTEFLVYKGLIMGTRTEFVERKRIIKLIKSNDILLTYKRRFLKE